MFLNVLHVEQIVFCCPFTFLSGITPSCITPYLHQFFFWKSRIITKNRWCVMFQEFSIIQVLQNFAPPPSKNFMLRLSYIFYKIQCIQNDMPITIITSRMKKLRVISPLNLVSENLPLNVFFKNWIIN